MEEQVVPTETEAVEVVKAKKVAKQVVVEEEPIEENTKTTYNVCQ